MTLGITGRLVPLSRNPAVAPSEDASFRGSVWIGEDGRIAAVRRSERAPAGFEHAPVVDVGSSLVVPGFIDLHSHLAYASLPLWVEPGRSTPFAHHDIWPTRPSYAERVTWPAYALITAAPLELLAYAEVRALVGGTTSIQGSPPSNRPLDGWLARNVEDERLGGQLEPTRIMSSTLTLDDDELARRAERMASGSTFIYHCAEGQPRSLAAREFDALRRTGCLQRRLVTIHTNALEPAAYQAWREPGAVVWSPFSNLWLYGSTVDVPAVRAHGIALCLGSDWGPSGTRNVLGELKVAAILSRQRGWDLSPLELVKMITANPGDLLAAAWGVGVGRLEPGALADIAVIDAPPRARAFDTLLRATERDVRLVLVGGRPQLGTPALMREARARHTSELRVTGEARSLALTQLGVAERAWSFQAVLERLTQVQRDPKGNLEAALARSKEARALGAAAPLELALDMPLGSEPITALPRDLSQIVVPPLQPLEHDRSFLEGLRDRGFHHGLLDGLLDFYS